MTESVKSKVNHILPTEQYWQPAALILLKKYKTKDASGNTTQETDLYIKKLT